MTIIPAAGNGAARNTGRICRPFSLLRTSSAMDGESARDDLVPTADQAESRKPCGPGVSADAETRRREGDHDGQDPFLDVQPGMLAPTFEFISRAEVRRTMPEAVDEVRATPLRTVERDVAASCAVRGLSFWVHRLADRDGDTLGELTHAIEAYFDAAPGTGMGRDLAGLLGISPGSASEHAKSLRLAGLVTSHRHGNTVRHYITPLGHSLQARNGRRP